MHNSTCRDLFVLPLCVIDWIKVQHADRTTNNINTKMGSIRNSENIQKNEGEPDCTISYNEFSSVTMNKLVLKARESIL